MGEVILVRREASVKRGHFSGGILVGEGVPVGVRWRGFAGREKLCWWVFGGKEGLVIL